MPRQISPLALRDGEDFPDGNAGEASLVSDGLPLASPASFALPEVGYLRQRELLAIIPISAATLWRKVREGSFPAPVRLSARVVAWRVGDVTAWMRSRSA
jgi:predicted DNA-binding transcriptional regulator AlpA